MNPKPPLSSACMFVISPDQSTTADDYSRPPPIRIARNSGTFVTDADAER